jgi:hypothetical protein
MERLEIRIRAILTFHPDNRRIWMGPAWKPLSLKQVLLAIHIHIPALVDLIPRGTTCSPNWLLAL